jgi:hypothetical protein
MADFRQLIRASERKYPNLNYLTEDSETSRELAGVFGVSENETPLVCTIQRAKDLTPSFSKDVLITDTFVLIKDGDKPVMRMPLSQLHCVLISYNSRQKKVLFISTSGRIELYTPKMIFQDRISFELYSLLVTLQSALINEIPALKESYYHTLDALSSYVQSCFKNQAYLSDENRELLNEILRTDPNNLIAGMVLKEDNYRTFESHADIKAHESEFFSNYLNLIASDYSTKFYKTMIKAYSRLLTRDSLPLKEAYLLCVLALRMNDEKADLLYKRIKTYLTKSQKQFIHFLAARASREKMDLCMSSILTGRMPSPIEYSSTDDMGFDCLHYSLILEEKEMVSALLKQKSWGEGAPQNTVGLASSFYNYFFLAAWHFNDTLFLKEVFLFTRNEAAESHRTLKRISSLSDIAESRLSLVKNRLASTIDKKHRALHSSDPSSYNEYEQTITMLLEEKSDIELEIETLKEWKQDAECELDALFRKALSDAREMLSVLESTPHPMVKYMLQALCTPESFIALHAQTPDTYYLLKYRGQTFIGTNDNDLGGVAFSWILEHESKDRDRFFRMITPPIKNPWLDFKRRHKKEEERRKADERRKSEEQSSSEYSQSSYGYEGNTTADSLNISQIHWFSEAAIHDDSILKKEYHLLIKRYHPDETGNNDGLEKLKEIIEEKDMILRQAQ